MSAQEWLEAQLRGTVKADRARLLAAGRARVAGDQLRSVGPLFEVYDATLLADGGPIPVCIKVVGDEPRIGQPIGRFLAARLLLTEAATVARVGWYWNHGVLAVGRWTADGALVNLQPATDNISALLLTDPHQVVMVMPRWAGRTLDKLPEAREYFPRIVPPLWRALSVCAHGNLSPQAILVDDGGRFFRLLSPGVAGAGGLPDKAAAAYPTAVPRTFGTAPYQRSPRVPAPADIQAMGLVYFEILTGARLQDLLGPLTPALLETDRIARLLGEFLDLHPAERNLCERLLHLDCSADDLDEHVACAVNRRLPLQRGSAAEPVRPRTRRERR